MSSSVSSGTASGSNLVRSKSMFERSSRNRPETGGYVGPDGLRRIHRDDDDDNDDDEEEARERGMRG